MSNMSTLSSVTSVDNHLLNFQLFESFFIYAHVDNFYCFYLMSEIIVTTVCSLIKFILKLFILSG